MKMYALSSVQTLLLKPMTHGPTLYDHTCMTYGVIPLNMPNHTYDNVYDRVSVTCVCSCKVRHTCMIIHYWTVCHML